jgi:hypothetical protein
MSTPAQVVVPCKDAPLSEIPHLPDQLVAGHAIVPAHEASGSGDPPQRPATLCPYKELNGHGFVSADRAANASEGYGSVIAIFSARRGLSRPATVAYRVMSNTSGATQDLNELSGLTV